MKIFIGADHAGYALKEALRDHLLQQGYEVEDLGVFSPEPADYPDIAHQLTARVVAQPDSRGILICGTGIGMCIAANKRPGIRAAHATEPVSAQLARAHNDANVLCLGGRMLGIELAKAIADAFLRTPFSNSARHLRRVGKLELP